MGSQQVPLNPSPQDPGLGLEAWLRPGWRRWLAIVGLVLLAALLATPQPRDFPFRGSEPEGLFERLFLDRVIGLAIWVLVASRAMVFARFLYRRTRPLWFGLILQLGLALLLAAGMDQVRGWVWDQTVQPVFSAYWASGTSGFERAGPRNEPLPVQEPPGSAASAGRSEDSPRRGPSEWRRSRGRRASGREGFPYPRELSVYAILLAISAASTAFLERRQAERQSAGLALASARLEGELLRARLEAIGQRLQPHFLFNALHAVGGLVRTERPGAALEALSDLAELLRQSLAHGATATVPLGVELDLIERYLAFEGRRFQERLEVEVDVPPALLSAAVPSLILLPLVENAVKHGVSSRPAGGRVLVQAELQGGRLLLRVIDTPRRAEDPSSVPAAAQTPPSLGLGLELVRERLSLLHPGGARLIEEPGEQGGRRTTVDLPYSELAEGRLP